MGALKLTLLPLVLGQAVCLALGLWVQQRLLREAARWHGPGASGAVVAPARPTPTPGAARPGAAPSEPDAAELIAWLPTAGVTAFVWICGLQGAVAYLLLSRTSFSEVKSRKRMEDDILQQMEDLRRTRDAVVFGLAKLAESRDAATGGHLERIAQYSTHLAAALHRHPRYRDHVTAAFVRSIGVSSALHDIGKVGVPDAILLKPQSLTRDERLRMQVHPTTGGECIREIELRLGRSNFLEMAREIALCHHERWDGQGYPRGLAGVEIPLAARIVAIADVYDALVSKRVYKDALPHDECLAMIRDQAGAHFDPGLVEIFLTIATGFRDIAAQWDHPLRATDDPAPSEHSAPLVHHT